MAGIRKSHGLEFTFLFRSEEEKIDSSPKIEFVPNMFVQKLVRNNITVCIRMDTFSLEWQEKQASELNVDAAESVP